MSDHRERVCTYCGSLLHHEDNCALRKAKEKRITLCEHYNKITECEFKLDPFIAEVFEDEKANWCSWWCDDCYRERKEEV